MKFNININYPLEDFIDDMERIIKKGKSNVIDFPPSLRIVDDDTGEVDILSFKTTHPMYTIGKHFLDKYCPEIGRSRFMKFMSVSDFIRKWQSILEKEKLIIKEPFQVRDDFVGYLLKIRINKRSVVIPKAEIKEFIKNRNTKQN